MRASSPTARPRNAERRRLLLIALAAVKLDAAPMNLIYMVRVVTPGRYSVPGTFVEDMYRPELRIVGERGAPLDVVDSVAGRR